MTLLLLSTALCYFCFNWTFFTCSSLILELSPTRKWNMLWTFVLNYTVFYLCSMLDLHLIVNWIVFLFLLFGEALLLFHRPIRECFLLSLLGTQLGLAVNILFRSLFAAVLDIPLVAFDNNPTIPGNMKAYPILLGFITAGMIFWCVEHFHLLKKLHLVLKDPVNLTFLLSLLIAMQLYLCLNLLVYYINENLMILKLWSMKSSVFVLVGESLSVVFSIRMGELSAYRAENRKARQQLAEDLAREETLRVIAATDPLTGCENRMRADKRLRDVLGSGRPFCLAFVDLNGLKAINDGLGHEMGDHYLLAVSGALQQVCGDGDFLFRYGGDEFLLLFAATADEAAERLATAQALLQQASGSPHTPFPMSISYGFSSREDGTDPEALIDAADTRMYRMKTNGRGRG